MAAGGLLRPGTVCRSSCYTFLPRLRPIRSSAVRFAADSPLEGDGFEPSVPRKAPDIDALKRRCSVHLAIGTQTGFAIGGFARVVAAAVQGEGPNAWVPVALLNLAICVVASIAAWTARDLTPIRR